MGLLQKKEITKENEVVELLGFGTIKSIGFLGLSFLDRRVTMVELLSHEHNCFSYVGSKIVESFGLQWFFGILFFLQRIFRRQGRLTGLLFLLNGGVLFRFFGKSLLFEGARCTSTGFWRHGSEMSGEFVILLRYDILELREMGRVRKCGLQKLQKLQKGIGVFHYVG